MLTPLHFPICKPNDAHEQEHNSADSKYDRNHSNQDSWTMYVLKINS